MRTNRPLLATIASAILITACGSSGGSADPTSAATAATDSAATDTAAPASATGAAQVNIKNSRFDPLEITIAAGETVTFTNDDPFAHTVTAKDDSPQQFDSDRISGGATFDVTFDEAGTYNYFCQIHPTMRASVTVG